MASERLGNRYAAPWGNDKVTGRCPNPGHGVDSSFNVRDRRAVWPHISSDLVIPPGLRVFEVVLACMVCGHTVVEFHIYTGKNREPLDKPIHPKVAADEVVRVWPKTPPRELDTSAPEPVRSLYREASTGESAGTLRGAAALYRAAVEELCLAQGAAGRDLKEKINNLATKGVDQAIVDDLHQARLLGNWSLHEGISFSAEEIDDVAGLIDEAVNILYVEPARRAEMRDARKARRDANRRSTG